MEILNPVMSALEEVTEAATEVVTESGETTTSIIDTAIDFAKENSVGLIGVALGAGVIGLGWFLASRRKAAAEVPPVVVNNNYTETKAV